ncbi:MAG: hypothetical protein KAJ58_00395 [Candidatus Pacebacteria bacterium]|nr:hypothetical protein [Candidatus Paceibacterota bacterium]
MFAFKQLEEKFLSIPEDIREAISSNKVNERLLILANEYKLQFDEAEELTKEIGYIMLGLKPRTNFVKNVQTVTELNSEKAKKLAEEINNTIFADIRESLRKIHNTVDEDAEDLDEDLVREELLNELSNPQKEITDLVETPKNSLEHENIKTLKQEKTEAREKDQQSPVLEKQKDEKSYTIDPYREPIE